jgi:hypothetical protein
MGEHDGFRPAAFSRLGRPEGHAEDVVDMAMRVHRRVQPLSRPPPQIAVHRRATNELPVSTSTRPSAVANADTVANEGTNATPSQISAKPPR